MNLISHEIMSLYFYTATSPGSTLEICGITLHAAGYLPRKLIRYSSMLDMKMIWCIDFHNSDNVVRGSQYIWNKIRIERIRGDLTQLEKDFTILKLFRDDWILE